MDTARYADFYRDKLLDDVIPFWVHHSPDLECGGYFTCLDRRGDVYDTDKFMWLQGREVWVLAKMYRCADRDENLLDLARLGAEFIRDHGFDENGRIYFALDRTGKAYANTCIFSDCFCAMGLAEYAAAAGADWARDLALKIYRGVQDWLDDRKDPYSRFVPGVRPMVSLAYDMINVNMSQELASAIGGEMGEESFFRRCGLASARRILDLHVDRKSGLIFDNVAPDGSHPDTFAGRVILPGHALECLWFLISAGSAWGADDIVAAAIEAIPDILEFGWDSQYGGFFYYLDALGKPPEQLMWDRKLWWVHGEALVAALLAYKHTGRDEFAEWFEKIHEYTWERFSDGEFGEWFGYLDRGGEVFLDLKGGKWKGCFHVPRTLWVCRQLLEDL